MPTPRFAVVGSPVIKLAKLTVSGTLFPSAVAAGEIVMDEFGLTAVTNAPAGMPVPLTGMPTAMPPVSDIEIWVPPLAVLPLRTREGENVNVIAGIGVVAFDAVAGDDVAVAGREIVMDVFGTTFVTTAPV